MIDPAEVHIQTRGAEAEQHCRQTLLNCYCRETAAPAGRVQIGMRFGQNDWPLSLRSAVRGGEVLHVALPHSRSRLLVAIEAISASGHYRHRSPVFFKAGGPWRTVTHRELAMLIIGELSAAHARPFNSELLDQIENSTAVTRRILSTVAPRQTGSSPLDDFLDSEQSLFLGHPFHPAPKSRQGFSAGALHAYSPELGARFRLHYFAVRHEDVAQDSVLGRTCDELVADAAPGPLRERCGPGMALLPAHPWQAVHLRRREDIREALRSGRVVDLGPHGNACFATSSLRTVFHPRHPFFYKFSLNVRLTNCVRKNAYYELEGALAITRLLKRLLPDLKPKFPGLGVLEEPAWMSLDLGGPRTDERRELMEGFAVILRDGVQGLQAAGITPLLTGALFGNGVFGRAVLEDLLRKAADARRMALDETRLQWFAAYAEQLIHPVLYSLFHHGIVFEPHLQNVLVGIEAGWPTRIILRDFEGVKLAGRQFPDAALEGLSDRAKQALRYTDEQAWHRVAYCLLVNHLAEAIAQLGAGRPRVEAALWDIVRDQLGHYQARWGEPQSSRRIDALLGGAPLPAKANLITRFMKRADRGAGYVPLPNPMAGHGGDAA